MSVNRILQLCIILWKLSALEKVEACQFCKVELLAFDMWVHLNFRAAPVYPTARDANATCLHMNMFGWKAVG